MRSMLRGAVVAGSALAALLATAPAQAEAGPWTYSEGYQYADVQWTLAGHVDGRPGNAHSGYFNFEGDDDGITAELYDWRCPSGVEAPPYPGTVSPCVLKASIWIQQPNFQGTYHFGTYLVRNRVQDVVPVEDSLTGEVVDQPIDVRMHGLSPATRTVSYFWVDSPGERFRYREVNLERTATVTGTVAWLDFSDPRVELTSSRVYRWDDWVKLPGVPVPG